MILFAVKILCLCVATAAGETLHGIVRNVLVVPKLGLSLKKAKQYSIVTGLILSFIICYVMVPWLESTAESELIMIGVMLSLFMAMFDIILARYVIKQKWTTVISDFNVAKGNYLVIGLIVMIFLPYLAFLAHVAV